MGVAATAPPGGAFHDLRRAVRRRKRARLDAYDAVERAVNPALERPKLVADAEIAEFTRRNGERYAMVKTPRGPNYVRLTDEERDLVALMDGSRSVSDIVVSRFQSSGEFELSAVVDLVEDLRQGGFFEQPFVSVPDAVRDARRAARSRVPRRLRTLAATRRVEFTRAHGFFEALYRHFARVFFTRTATVIGLAVLGVGGVAFVALVGDGKYSLLGESAVGGIAVLYAVDLASTFVHEAGHALAVIHSRRHVNAAGMMLYLGMPAFYIDTTDMWMAERKPRIVSTAAGPYAEWVLAGAASIIALVLPAGPVTGLLYKYAVLSYVTILQNLIPFLRLDGYYAFMDILDVINLRERSFEFLREELPGKLRRREKLTRQQKGFAAYGVLAAAFVSLAVAFSILFWGRIFSKAVASAFSSGVVSSILIVPLILLVMAPMVRAAIRTVRAIVRQTRFAVRAARRGVQRRWRREASALISALPLGEGLDAELLDELAAHVDLRRVPAGAAVVTQGERGDEFFVVRSGSLDVVRAGEDGRETQLRRLERGRSFGEVALLEASPRTATVRARVPSQVFVVAKGDFDRVLASRLETAEEIRSDLLSITQLRALPMFRGLDESDASRLLSGARWEQYGAGQRIVKQGEEGDTFYVVASGKAEVLVNRHIVGTLGAGDYFGEAALLLDEPRSATVRAATPVRVLELDRRTFRRVLASGFRRGRLAPGRELVREWEH